MGILDLLLKKLDFSVEGVLEAAAEQSKLFDKAVKYRIVQMTARIAAESLYDSSRAGRALKIREEFRKSGDKLTEGHLEELLLTDRSLSALQSKLAQAETSEEYSKLLLEAYRHRRDSLQVISQIAGRDISMERSMEIASAKLAGARQKLQQKYAHEPEV